MPCRPSRGTRRRISWTRVFSSLGDGETSADPPPSWEELIERKVDADMRAAADVRDDMWGWEPTKERVLLVGVGGQKGDEKAGQYGLEASLAELAQLADTAGLEVVGTVTQRLRAPHPGTYVGKGKLAELRRACGLPSDLTAENLVSEDRLEYASGERRLEKDEDEDKEDDGDDGTTAAGDDTDAFDVDLWDEEAELEKENAVATLELKKRLEENPVDTVIFDAELTPRQARNLSRALDDKVGVCDRTMLILDIFSQRARTAEGKLQVEMASLEYQLPRLSKMWTHLERQAGGAGGGAAVKGMGEKQIEIDKRLLRDRITFLKKRLNKVRTHRALYRVERKESSVPVVSLVGYTNAGKSSLLNALTRSSGTRDASRSVLAEDKLFATLDPTTRRIELPDGKTILCTDTVGFIQRLPTNLIAAFRATLEEIKESSLLIHVVDVSSPFAEAQMSAVDGVLDALGADAIPRLVVWNKCDAILGLEGSFGSGALGWAASPSASGAASRDRSADESRVEDDDDENGGGGGRGKGGKTFAFPGSETRDRGNGGDDDDAEDDDCEWEEDSESESESESDAESDAETRGRDRLVGSWSSKREARRRDDGVPEWIKREARSRGAVAVSAASGAGVVSLAGAIQNRLMRGSMVSIAVTLPYEEGKVLGEIRRAGVVTKEAYGDSGVFIEARVPLATARRSRAAAAFKTQPPAENGFGAWSAEDQAELERLLREEQEIEERSI